ncbi:GMP synthase, partial [Candidatus Aerophobetes bacterium Ae_b3a]
DLKNAKIKKSKLTKARIDLLREADNITTEFMRQRGLWNHFWQFPVILIPLSLHGGEAIALRPVLSIDGMTAEYAKIKFSVLKELSDKIMTMDGVDAVLCDITNKPPATIEWE